jgi:glucose dehydrogenase
LSDVAAYRPGVYHMTSPPAVIDDLVIVGSSINDNDRVDMPQGVVRAFDARSGVLRWKWDPIPQTRTSPGRMEEWGRQCVVDYGRRFRATPRVRPDR